MKIDRIKMEEKARFILRRKRRDTKFIVDFMNTLNEVMDGFPDEFQRGEINDEVSPRELLDLLYTVSKATGVGVESFRAKIAPAYIVSARHVYYYLAWNIVFNGKYSHRQIAETCCQNESASTYASRRVKAGLHVKDDIITDNYNKVMAALAEKSDLISIDNPLRKVI